MSNTFLPFNFAPKAHVILNTGGTTSYTIPANEYALVTISSVITTSASSLTVNSVEVYKSAFQYNFNQSSSIGAAQWYTNNTQFPLYYMITYNQTAGDWVREGVLPSGVTLYTPAVPSYTTTFYLSSAISMTEPSTHTLWVKSGDILAISGGDIRVIIHRYDLPS